MNPFLERYCTIRNVGPQDVVNKDRRFEKVRVRNALMFLTWYERKQTITRHRLKKEVITEIGAEFDMTRHNCYEQITTFEQNLTIRENYKFFRDLCEELSVEMPKV